MKAYRVGQAHASATATADESGSYLLDGLAPGDYMVEVVAPGYVSERFNDVGPGATGATFLAVTLGALHDDVDFGLDVESVIEGVVRGPGSSRDRDTYCVTATSTTGYARTTCGTLGGRYRISKLPPGTYVVGFSSELFVPEYWNDAATLFEASPVSLGRGQKATADATLVRRAHISGTVLEDGTATGMSSVPVEILSADGTWIAGEWTDASGGYDITVAPGTYFVRAGGGSNRYVSIYYGGSATAEGATSVSAIDGTATTSIDLTVRKRPRIVGTLTDERTADPMANAWVIVIDEHGTYAGGATTDSDGSFEIFLGPGTYRVEFTGTSNYFGFGGTRYVGEWFDNAATAESAAPIVLTDSSGAVRADAALAPRQRITGRLTDAGTGEGLAGKSVNVYAAGGGYVAGSLTNLVGDYEVWVAPGSYRVEFPSGSTQLGTPPYLGEWFDDARTFESSDIVVVTGDADATGVDGHLDLQATISGRVTAASTGSPLTSILITAYREDGTWASSTTAGADGSYRLLLGEGAYRLQFSSLWWATNEYQGEWYDNVSTQAAASVISLAAGQQLSGIDAALGAPTKLTGRVTSAETGEGVRQAWVEVYSAAGVWVTGMTTDADGRYQVSPRPRVVLRALHGFSELHQFRLCRRMACRCRDEGASNCGARRRERDHHGRRCARSERRDRRQRVR